MSTTIILWYLRRAGELHIDQRTRTDAHEVHEDDFPSGGLRVRAVAVEIFISVTVNSVVRRLARLERVGGHVHMGELVALGELEVAASVPRARELVAVNLATASKTLGPGLWVFVCFKSVQ